MDTGRTEKTQDLLITIEVLQRLHVEADTCLEHDGRGFYFDEQRWREACYRLGLPVDDLYGYMTRLVVVADGPPRIRRAPENGR